MPISSNKLRVLLATLLLAPNRTVSVEALSERLWGPTPPETARATLQVHVMRLRRALGADQPIRTTAGGYRIVVEPSQVDVSRFRGLVSGSRLAGEPDAEADLLGEALSLWRGPALLGVDSDPLHQVEVPLLADERVRAVERRAEIAVASGQYAEVIGELTAVVREYPLREPPWAHLIDLLDRSGRRADALEAYQRMYRIFRDELGIGPCDRIRRLHDTILSDGTAVATGPPPTGRSVGPPRQLPAVLGTVVGRRVELTHLRLRLSNATGAARLVVVCGAPGVGKTALALHAAHGVRDRFPDGQLHVDLHGHSLADPLASTAVLERFLRALGVPPDAVPADAQERADLYRSMLADRRVIVVLDNAATAEQVRPLLPGGAGSAALVTSRNSLGGLVVDGGEAVTLGPLDEQDAVELLAGIVGRARAGADPGATRDLAQTCGRLPLALRIAGVRLHADPHLSLTAYNAELRRPGGLDRMRVRGDERAAVRSAFDLSYLRLPASVARTFARLGLLPGGFTVDTAAVAAGVGIDEAAQALDALVAANLVVPAAGRRYRIPDLLSRYAADRATDDPGGRAARPTAVPLRSAG